MSADSDLVLRFRNGVLLERPLELALLFLTHDYSYGSYDSLPIPTDDTIRLDEIRAANRIGARMSSEQVAALYERRDTLESALRRIPGDASLVDDVDWDALHELYAAGEGVPGVGLPKLTKFLHKKRPALVPMLDSFVEGYLRSVDEIPPRALGFGVVGCALTRSYKRELDANLDALRQVKEELARRGFQLTECRVLDLYTWAYASEALPAWAADAPGIARAPTERISAPLEVTKEQKPQTDGPLTLGELRARREEILAVAASHGARDVRVFGSVARGDAGAHDVDFLVEMEPGRSLFDMGALLMDLEDMLGCQVDVVSERGLRRRIHADVLAEARPL